MLSSPKFYKLILYALFLQTFAFQLHAKELTIGFGQDRAPFVIGESEKGLEIDIFREVLALKGYTMKVRHFSNKRLQFAMEKMSDIDGTAAVQANEKDSFHYVAKYISYDNFAISRKKDQLSIKSIEDLKGHSIVTWQNAYRDLGPEYNKIFKPEIRAPYKENYKEIVSQRSQNIAFWRHSAEIIIIDKTIFLWYKKQLSSLLNTDAELVYHPIFAGKTFFHAGFRDPKIAQDFAEGLQQLKDSGRYKELYQKYTSFKKSE